MTGEKVSKNLVIWWVRTEGGGNLTRLNIYGTKDSKDDFLELRGEEEENFQSTSSERFRISKRGLLTLAPSEVSRNFRVTSSATWVASSIG